MNPEDIRNEQWAKVQRRFKGDMKRVHEGLVLHGPTTTRKLSYAIPMGLLTVRPRMTNLCDMGLAECIGKEGSEGIYQAIPMEQALRNLEQKMKEATYGEQLQLI